MSISRFTLLMAIAVASLAPTAARADDLAGAVAARLRDSGAIAGYRVKVKAKAGTVWLEGQVADAEQLGTAVSLAENTEGVERVVNRLSVAPKPAAPAAGGFGLPLSIRDMIGLESPAAGAAADSLQAEETVPTEAAPATPVRANAANPSATGVALTQAVTGAAAAPRSGAPGGRVGPPLPLSSLTGRMLPSAVGARPATGPHSVQPRIAARMAARNGMVPVQKTSAMGEPLHLSAPANCPPGGLTDGQMVPGSMRVTEGPAGGGYAGDGYDDGSGGMSGGPAGGPGMGGPMAMGSTGVGMPPVPMRGDGPNMPNYAWPSYAAHPNYAALQYPTQYSPTAWPYIGPFYPYPQVPLGWRRVSLEWDDGWWFLDFDDRHHHSHHR
ncbi:MAG: BON domain-containing protein [Planctomycetia bacterium]|nr:BON domain-containing protein [Planctomycetia bacterium]